MDSNYSGLSNWTLDEDDDLFSGEDTESEWEQFHRRLQNVSVVRQITRIIAFFGIIGVIIFDIYLIVVICRNKKLKSLNVSKYVVNLSIFNVLLFLAIPAYQLFLQFFWSYINFSYHVLCFEKQLESVFELGLFLCAIGLAVEWLIKIYFGSKLHPILLTIHDHSIKIVYLICLVDVVTDTILCFQGYFYPVTALVSNVIFFLLVILISVCQFLAYKINVASKKNLPLTVATVMMLCWLPASIYHFLEVHFYSSYTFRFILIVTYFIPEYLAYGCTIVVVVMLTKLNKYFKVAFTRSCSRYVRNYSGDDESFEESEDEVSVNVNVLAKDATVL